MLGVVQIGVCIGVLWLAAAVAPNKGESDKYWVRGSSVKGRMGDGPNGDCSCKGICNGCASDASNGVWLCGDSDDAWVTKVSVRDRIVGDPDGVWISVVVLSPGTCWFTLICSSVVCWAGADWCLVFWEGSPDDVSKALSNDSFIDDSASRCFCSSICCCKWKNVIFLHLGQFALCYLVWVVEHLQ